MAKIYEFPQGAERSKLKKEIIRERKKRLRETNGNPVIRHAKWFWFYLRLATAGALHLVSVISLAVLGAFSKAIFWIGGMLCVVTWAPVLDAAKFHDSSNRNAVGIEFVCHSPDGAA